FPAASRRNACARSRMGRSGRSPSATTSPAGRRTAARSPCSGSAHRVFEGNGWWHGGLRAPVALLPARNVAHVRQMMRDALVAIDAGFFARKQQPLMSFNCARALTGYVHRLGAVAVAAFKRVVCFHARPLMDREFETMIEKLLACIDR